jgi:hypothetical protein
MNENLSGAEILRDDNALGDYLRIESNCFILEFKNSTVDSEVLAVILFLLYFSLMAENSCEETF